MTKSCWVAFVWLLVCSSATVSTSAASAQRKPSKDSNKNKNRDETIRNTPCYEPPVRPLPTTAITRTQSLARQAVYAPIRSTDDHRDTTDDEAIGGHRMQEYSLAQQMEFLAQHNPPKNGNHEEFSYFEVLLQMEHDEQQQQRDELQENNSSATTTVAKKPEATTVSPVFWSILGSASILAVSSWLWDPRSAQTLWKTVIGKKLGAALAVAWLPWVWAHPAQLALVDLVVLVQLARQPAVLPFLRTNVLPVVWQTCKTMMIAEVWSRSWKWFFAHLEQVRQSVLESVTDPNEARSSSKEGKDLLSLGLLSWPTNSSPPSWLVEAHSLVVGSIRKGIKSSVKKSIQATITSSFSVWRNVLEEQVKIVAH